MACYGKTQNRIAHCRFCGQRFVCSDVKASKCPACRKPRTCRCGCGWLVTTPGCFWKRGHNPLAHTKEAHAKQAAKIRGLANPAKRPEVRRAISRGIKKAHPSKLYPERWRAMGLAIPRAPRISSLERRLAPFIPTFEAQGRIGHYRVDFLDRTARQVIEVNGCWFHCCRACGIKPRCPTQRACLANDRRKHVFLRKQGWELLIVWGCKLEAFIDSRDHKSLRNRRRAPPSSTRGKV